MAKRTIYHVVPHEEGWAVRKEHAERASDIERTKVAAVDVARDLARGSGLAQLKIHRADGVLQTEHTYGCDPRKTRG